MFPRFLVYMLAPTLFTWTTWVRNKFWGPTNFGANIVWGICAKNVGADQHRLHGPGDAEKNVLGPTWFEKFGSKMLARTNIVYMDQVMRGKLFFGANMIWGIWGQMLARANKFNTYRLNGWNVLGTWVLARQARTYLNQPGGLETWKHVLFFTLPAQ